MPEIVVKIQTFPIEECISKRPLQIAGPHLATKPPKCRITLRQFDQQKAMSHNEREAFLFLQCFARCFRST